ncbi:MAG TPA: endonuclease/exonuclease/phosphatase family protein, partial [Stellaceae bacterium]
MAVALSLAWIVSGIDAEAGPVDLSVMTQNLYLGADTTPILDAQTPAQLQAAVQAAAQSVVLNNFPARAAAIASEAAAAGGPLLIGLQEAEIISSPAGSLDYADTLISALAAKGLHYTYMIPGVGNAVHTGFSLASNGFHVTDQEVVLVRTGVPGFSVSGVSAPTFVNNVTLNSPLLGPIPLDRGYVRVDATLDGTPFEFVSTHLDETHSAAEPAEVGEILAALGAGGEPQLVVGDFNATPSDTCGGLPCGPADMVAAGFADTAAALGALGPTCCQPPDLDNPVSALSKRYDYIFERNFSSVEAAFLVGNTPFEAVRPIWPSDHAGVVAEVTVPEPSAASFLVPAIILAIGLGLRLPVGRQIAGARLSAASPREPAPKLCAKAFMNT